jgi:hypothetical protein
VSDDINGALSCLRILKIIRIGQISALIASLKFERGTKAFMKLLYLIMIMYLFVHVQGCLYFLFARITKVWVPPVDYIYGTT